MDGTPLAGVKVVEAASYVSGPFATLILADLGAEVIKVEPPSGDPYRRFGPQDEDQGRSGGPMFRAVNRNKTTRVLDLKAREGVAALHRLLDDTDVLLSNWRPAVAAGFGLDRPTVEDRWPRLVWVRVSGYGQDGPHADLPAFDAVIQARTGLVASSGDGSPELLPMYVVDKVTAMTAVQAALAGLVKRSATGRGTTTDVAMLDAASYFNVPDILAGHQSPDRPDPRIHRHLAAARPLPTKDGAVMLSPVSGRQLKWALDAAGIGDRAAWLKAISDPTLMAQTFYEEMAVAVETESTEYWVRRFAGADVPVTAVLSAENHLDDEQVVHNRMYRVGTDPGGRPVRRPRHPALFDGEPVETPDLPPPALP